MYAELHCKTNFSFLEGASHPEEYCRTAKELGYEAVAITDRNSLAGIVRAHTAAKEEGVKLIIGAEVFPVDAPPIVLLATDKNSYGSLSQLLTQGRRRAAKGECHLLFADIVTFHAGLIACIPLSQRQITHRPSKTNGKTLGTSQAWEGTESFVSLQALHAYRELFGDRTYALAEFYLGPDDEGRLTQLQALAQKASLPLVAAGDVHYHVPERQALCDVLHATRLGCTVTELGQRMFFNAERHLRTLDEISRVYKKTPELISRTTYIASLCNFSLDELRYDYPAELVPHGKTPIQYLRELSLQGAKLRYPQGIPPKVRGLLEHELGLIEELHYEAYFLTVWDLVRFARSKNILCQGRGSAANSVVCFCLGVTSVDPERLDVLFERFISKERGEAPDIDIDFEHERREEVLQYLYDKYGRERAAMTAEVITYCSKSAIRDVGKALGLSLDRLDALSSHVDSRSRQGDWSGPLAGAGISPASELGKRLAFLTNELITFPRHLSQHVGGMVIAHRPISEIVPIENAAMEGRTVIQWNKDDLDALGILKVDCLSLGMLTAIRKALDLVHRHWGQEVSLATVPEGDQRVYDMLCKADSVGVFQVESRAQMSMLPRLRPRCYYDLVIEVAIVRPGPIQGDMVHPYLRRRSGEERVEYPSAAIRQVLEKTLGVPLFQEQAMRLAVVAAGFTPGEADQLRRAMAAWRRPGVIAAFQEKLIRGMKENGLTEEFAERVFHQIQGFGEYGFPESHAASFALLVYVSSWLKCHYPAAFTAAVLNSQPMGFYAPAQLVRDAKEHGVTVLPIDVNQSEWDCTLENDAQNKASFALRLGFRLVSGLSEKHVQTLLAARNKSGPFQSVADCARRTKLPKLAMKQLADADAFSCADNRRTALWDSLAEHAARPDQPLFANAQETPEAAPNLPFMPEALHVVEDYRTVGLTLRNHPISFVREELNRLKVTANRDLATWPLDVPVRVAGLVLVRQHPSTAKGVIFATLEDETGIANLVIFPNIWERHKRVGRTASAFLAYGKVQREGEVIHVVVSRLFDLSAKLPGLSTSSRDFR